MGDLGTFQGGVCVWGRGVCHTPVSLVFSLLFSWCVPCLPGVSLSFSVCVLWACISPGPKLRIHRCLAWNPQAVFCRQPPSVNKCAPRVSLSVLFPRVSSCTSVPTPKSLHPFLLFLPLFVTLVVTFLIFFVVVLM